MVGREGWPFSHPSRSDIIENQILTSIIPRFSLCICRNNFCLGAVYGLYFMSATWNDATWMIDWLAPLISIRRSSTNMSSPSQPIGLDFRTWINWWILSVRCSSSNPTESSMQTSCAPCASGLWRAYIDPMCVRREGRVVNSWWSCMISALSAWVHFRRFVTMLIIRAPKRKFPYISNFSGVMFFFLRGEHLRRSFYTHTPDGKTAKRPKGFRCQGIPFFGGRARNATVD